MEIRISGNTVGELKAQIVDLAQMLLQADKLHVQQQAITGVTNAGPGMACPPPPPQPESAFGETTNDVPKESPTPKTTKKAAAPKDTLPTAAPAVDVEGKKLTRDDLADTLRILIAAVGGNSARALMSEMGFSRLGDIPESAFATFSQKCKDAIAKGKK